MSDRFPTADSRGGRGARAWATVNAGCIHPARPTSPEARFLVGEFSRTTCSGTQSEVNQLNVRGWLDGKNV